MLGMEDFYMGEGHTKEEALRLYRVRGEGEHETIFQHVTNRTDPNLYLALPYAVLKAAMTDEMRNKDDGPDGCKHLVLPKAPALPGDVPGAHVLRYFDDTLYTWSPKNLSWAKAIAQYESDEPNEVFAGEITAEVTTEAIAPRPHSPGPLEMKGHKKPRKKKRPAYPPEMVSTAKILRLVPREAAEARLKAQAAK